MLNGSTSPFEFLKVVFTKNIKTIKIFGGTDQAASLEMIVEDLENDLAKWRRLNSSNLSLIVEEEVKRLSDHMHKTYTGCNKHWKQSLKG